MPKFRPNPHLPPFPARTSHALLPLSPSPESPCATSPTRKSHNRKAYNRFSLPCDFQAGGAWRRAIPYTLKTPLHTPRENVMNRQSQRESLRTALNLHNLEPSCAGAADNPFELREHPGYRLRSPGKNRTKFHTRLRARTHTHKHQQPLVSPLAVVGGRNPSALSSFRCTLVS